MRYPETGTKIFQVHKYFTVATVMSQVLVLARQAITSWGGFHIRPSVEDVVKAIENLGQPSDSSLGVIIITKLLCAIRCNEE
ncbi:MAG: hypothetical protein MJE68_31850 [Proteobacteria bacterium]|nr:hypothetical protein [Pseudomonadota bacterium]